MTQLVLGTTIPGGKQFSLTTPQLVAAHKHILGVSGSGKTRFLASLWLQLASQGQAVSLIDPHGDVSRLLLATLMSNNVFADPRVFNRLYYVDFNRTDRTIPMNVLNQPYPPHTIAANMLEVCKRAWTTVSSTPSLDNVILASVLALVENKQPFTQLNKFLLDKAYRNSLVANVTDPLVRDFFRERFEGKTHQLTDSTLRRSFLLTFSPVLRNALGCWENRLNSREIIDHGISCIFNLGGLDEYTKRFLGCLLMVNFEQAFLSRATLPEDKRLPHAIVVDEFPLFATESGESFSVMLEQVRKYKGTLYLAHQSLSQLSTELAGSLQNALSIIFRLGFADAQQVAPRLTKHNPYRVKHQIPRSLFAPETSHPLYFTEAETTAQMREVIQSLETAQALVRIGRQTTRIQALSVPDPAITAKQVQTIEDIYAKTLLVPLAPAPVTSGAVEERTSVLPSPSSPVSNAASPTAPTPNSSPKRAQRRTGK